MMVIKSRVPKDFYKLFASKYIEYYQLALIAIYEEAGQSYSLLGFTEEECQEIIREKTEGYVDGQLVGQDEEEGEFFTRANLPSVLLRHLEMWGWLRRDYDEVLNQYVVSIPDYSQMFIEVFRNLLEDGDRMERGSILAIYSHLFTYFSDSEKNTEILKSALWTSKSLQQMLTDMQMFVGKISGLMNPVTFFLVNAVTVGLIYQGAIQVDAGVITQGEVVALVNYMGQILVELIKFANLIVTITKAIACGNRIWGVFELPEGEREISYPPQQKEPKTEDEMVMFSHVCLTYETAGAESLTDISFTAKKGETIGVIGGTGSGKTSLAHLIPAFYPHTKGEIRIDGKDILSYSQEELRRKVGIVMQKPVLFQGTIRENVLWGKKDAADAELLEALKTAQAYEVVEKKEGKLSEEVAQGGKNFSGGQRQRLTIARALVKQPEILILDDSASALDYATDAALRRAIAGMESQPTVFIVSQRASSIQYADKILVLDDGKLAGVGAHSELLENCGVYREIYYSQFPEKAGQKGVAVSV